MSINVLELIKDCPKFNITVSAEDLTNMVYYCIAETKRQIEQTLSDSKNETYLTRKETAKLLDCDLSSLWRYKQNKLLVPSKVGGKNKYKRSEIMNLLEGVK